MVQRGSRALRGSDASVEEIPCSFKATKDSGVNFLRSFEGSDGSDERLERRLEEGSSGPAFWS